MNNSMKNYYVLNQFLMGASLDTLPVDLLEGVDTAELKDVWRANSKTPAVRLTELEAAMLNLLRVPDYGLCVTDSGKVLSVSKVAAICREQGYKTEDCVHWAERLVLEVVKRDKAVPVTISDGVLCVDRKLPEKENLVTAMRKAFALYVWGTLDPTEKSKTAVNQLLRLCSPEGNVELSGEDLLDLLWLIYHGGLNVETLRRSVLQVHDLQPMFALTGLLAWWTTPAQKRVSLILPRGKSDRMAHVQIDIDELLRVCSSDLRAATKMIVKGDRIVVAE